ncbi:Mechanosensitive ion channel protein 10 [Linum grandiflorum]
MQKATSWKWLFVPFPRRTSQSALLHHFYPSLPLHIYSICSILFSDSILLQQTLLFIVIQSRSYRNCSSLRSRRRRRRRKLKLLLAYCSRMSKLEENNKPTNGTDEVVITVSNADAKLPPETLLRRRTFARSLASKPKSRFGEQPYTLDSKALDEHSLTLQEHFASSSPHKNISSVTRTVSISQKSPSRDEAEEEEEEEEEKERDLVRRVEIQQKKTTRRGKTVAKLVIQWAAVLIILGCLAASLTVAKLKSTTIWGLVLWKWCVIVIVTFYGLLVTSWIMQIVVLLIEINFLLRKKVLYFVHGLRKSVQVFVWIGFVLGTWAFVFRGGVHASRTATKVLDFVTWTLISLLIGSFLWLLKTLSMKILASNYHVKRYFDRIQESVFHQYVLQTLSGPPLVEEAEKVGKVPSTGLLSVRKVKGKGSGGTEKKVIDMVEVQRMKKEKVSAWTMKVLVDTVTKSGLSTISDSLDKSTCDNKGGQADNEVTNELEATIAALRIFRNVAPRRSKYIEEEDLLRFMIKEEVDLFFPLIEGSESGRIDKKAFTAWVVRGFHS